MELPNIREQMERIGFDTYVKAAMLLKNNPSMAPEYAVQRVFDRPEHVDFDAEVFTASVIDKLQQELDSMAEKPSRHWLIDDSFVRGMLWMLMLRAVEDIGEHRASAQ